MKRERSLGFARASAAAFGMWLLLSHEAVAYAQEAGSPWERDVRVEWTLERTKRPLWTLCGTVYNDRHVPARHVELCVERPDAYRRERRVGIPQCPIAESDRPAGVVMVEFLQNDGYAGRSVAPRPHMWRIRLMREFDVLRGVSIERK